MVLERLRLSGGVEQVQPEQLTVAGIAVHRPQVQAVGQTGDAVSTGQGEPRTAPTEGQEVEIDVQSGAFRGWRRGRLFVCPVGRTAYFTDPPMAPAVMYFWATRRSAIAGIDASTPVAITALQLETFVPR